VSGTELASLSGMYSLPIAAQHVKKPNGVDLSDDELRFVAWFMTDGGFKEETKLVISQCKPATTEHIRSLIERVFRRLKLWTGACDFTISPRTRETVQAHYSKIETDLDCIIAFENLKLLCESDRVATIPRKQHKGAIYARLNDLKIQPDLKIPKPLPADMGNWSAHLRSFWRTFSGIAPNLAKEIGTKPKKKKAAVPAAGPARCTVNVLRRGANLVQSGYVSLFSVGADPDNDASVMVIAKVFPAMRSSAYLVALRMSQSNALLAFACSCTNGCAFFLFVVFF
jgi:hypothetical protein